MFGGLVLRDVLFKMRLFDFELHDIDRTSLPHA